MPAIEERAKVTRYVSGATAHGAESTPPEPGRLRVLIAGAGPAGVEAALSLGASPAAVSSRRSSRRRNASSTSRRPSSRRSPRATAGAPDSNAWPARTCAAAPSSPSTAPSREVRLGDGEVLGYDALLIAVGGIQRSPYPRALAFGTPGSEERMHGLIQDLEDGYIKRIAFVVPPAASWPLPIYELALMTAERAFDMCVDVELTLVTSEPSPLALFGGDVSRRGRGRAGGGRDHGRSPLRTPRCRGATRSRCIRAVSVSTWTGS